MLRRKFSNGSLGRPRPSELLLKNIGATFGRTVTLKIPASFDVTPSTPRPLFVIAHPLGGSATAVQTHLGLSTLADDYPGGAFVIVASALGIGEPGNATAWNGSTSCCENDGPPPSYPTDDKGYYTSTATVAGAGLIPLATQMIALAGGAVDPHRVVWVGESNGAFMGERIACETTAITHLVDLAGSGRTASDAACTNTNTHYLTIQGPGDSTVAYGGGAAIPGLTPAMDGVVGFNTTNAQHVTRNGCSGTWASAHAGAAAATYDLCNDACCTSTETSCYIVTGCPGTGQVEGCDIGTTCGHSTNLTFNTTTNFRDLVISFVQNNVGR